MWFTYTLIGLLLLWLGDFVKKLMLSQWWNKEVFLFSCFVFYVTVLWVNYYFFADGIIDKNLIQSSFIVWVFDFLTPLWMLAALKYLDASLSFITIRLTASFFILYIWIYILWDKLSLYNFIWFLLWIIAIYFLSWFSFKEKHRIHKNEY